MEGMRGEMICRTNVKLLPRRVWRTYLVVYERRLVVSFVEQVVAVVEQQDVSRVIDERVVGDAPDGAQQRHDTHRVLGVPLEPVVAHLHASNITKHRIN